MSAEERIWYEDLPGFLSLERLPVFLIDRDMTYAQQLNAITRLILYFCLIVWILKQNGNILFLAIGWMLFTALLYEMEKKQFNAKRKLLETMQLQQNRRNEYCTRPTRDNPFMNVSYSDYKGFPSRPKACDINQSNVRRKVNKLFDQGVKRNIGDIFHKEASDRQFYTSPVTTIPNDQTGFASWLYESPRTCKEGNGQACVQKMYRHRM
jgi:hypothetical protein